MSYRFAVLLFIALLAANVRAGTYTLDAECDTYVQANLGTTNFGTTTKMYVANRNGINYHQDGLIRFDLNLIPAGEVIASATLQLTVNQQNGDSQTAYFANSDTWDETAVTWNNRPSTGAAIATWSVSALGAVTANVTTAAQTQYGTSNKRLSMYIKGTDLAKQTVYWTSEYTTPADRPKLIVTTTTGYGSAASLNSAIASATPGQTLYITNGTYSNWQINCTTSGTSTAPITIAAATPGGVTFTDPAPAAGTGTRFIVTGNYVTLSGLRFDQVQRTGQDKIAVVDIMGQHTRLTQCCFKRCGHTTDQTVRIVSVRYNAAKQGASYSQIDHNYFYDSLSVSSAITIGYHDNDYASKLPTHCLWEYNWFYKFNRSGDNGGEAIQLCSGGDGSGRFEQPGYDTCQFQMFTTVQYNYFYKADADREMCSIKCSDNTVQYNTFQQNTRSGSGLCIRGGGRNKIIGNFMINGYYGLRVYGHDHVITNNYLTSSTTGLIVNGVSPDGQPGEHCTYAYNTITGSFAARLDVPGTSGSPTYSAGAGNTWYNNIFKSLSGHAPVDTTYCGMASWVGTWNTNVLYDGGSGGSYWHPTGTIWGNTQLVLNFNLLRPSTVAPLSAALNVGTNLAGSPWYITNDFDGDARSTTPDIGCDETSTATPLRKPLMFTEVGPTYLVGVPWGDPVPDADPDKP